MSNVVNINSKGFVSLICRPCGHEFLRKEADPTIRHRCPRCKKYDAVVAYSQIEAPHVYKCGTCGGHQLALLDDGLQCFKCGCIMSPVDVWQDIWADGVDLAEFMTDEEEGDATTED